jgi:hypothetical protein
MKANKETCFIVIAPSLTTAREVYPASFPGKSMAPVRAPRIRHSRSRARMSLRGRARFREWLRAGRSHAK